MLKSGMQRPWNRPSLPVYSVVSQSQTTADYNMHICTYVSAVSMQPKRMMVALFQGSKTLANVLENGHFILQLLSEAQFKLVPILGQQSGWTAPKMALLQKQNLLSTWHQFPVLKDAAAYLALKVIDRLDAGDHILFICDVVKFKNNNDNPILTTQLLKNKKIIRA